VAFVDGSPAPVITRRTFAVQSRSDRAWLVTVESA
jgi:hypothetical protein